MSFALVLFYVCFLTSLVLFSIYFLESLRAYFLQPSFLKQLFIVIMGNLLPKLRWMCLNLALWCKIFSITSSTLLDSFLLGANLTLSIKSTARFACGATYVRACNAYFLASFSQVHFWARIVIVSILCEDWPLLVG